MRRFVGRWIGVTAIISTVLSIVACSSIETYGVMIGLFILPLIMFPISLAIMGLVLLVQLLTKPSVYPSAYFVPEIGLEQNTLSNTATHPTPHHTVHHYWERRKKPNNPRWTMTAAICLSILPLVLVSSCYVAYSASQARHHAHLGRLTRYQVHTRVLSVHVNGFASTHRNFLSPHSPNGDLGARYEMVRLIRIIINDEASQRQFEEVFNVELPEIDFGVYFFRVLPGQEYDAWRHGWLQTRPVHHHLINVYQVNIVR